MAEEQIPAEELDRIIDMLEEAGLIETGEQEDGRVVIRLTERGEQLREQLPDVISEDESG